MSIRIHKMLMTAILRVDQYESHFQITDLTIKKKRLLWWKSNRKY